MNLPKTMNAAILKELGKPLVVDKVELPSALSVGQVLIKIEYSGICGSQLGEIQGIKGEDRYLPHLLGHEGSGVVKMIGPGVRHVKLNDHVVLHWKQGKGIESLPPVYRWNGNDLNSGLITTFSEYSVVSENRVTSIDKLTDLDIAALYGCAVSTGFGVIENNAKIRAGESLVVFGAGGIGLNMVQAASLVSAYPIIAIDLFDNRLELARSLGATHTVNSQKQNAEEEITKILKGGNGLDVFIDNTGQPTIIELGYVLLNKKGRLVLVGVPKHSNNINIHSLPLHFGKTLLGSHGGDSIPEEDIPRFQKLLKAGLIQLKPLISEYFSLNDINKAIIGMIDGSITGRCLIKLS